MKRGFSRLKSSSAQIDDQVHEVKVTTLKFYFFMYHVVSRGTFITA
jgi:hypothetical protein